MPTHGPVTALTTGVTDLTPVRARHPPSLLQPIATCHGGSKMKLRNFGLTLTAAAAMAAGPSIAAESEVWLVNNSGRAIREIYLSPASHGQWGGDRLLDNAAV